MISCAWLDRTSHVFFHSGCPDGIAAREILRAGFPERNFSFHPYAFGTPVRSTKLEPLLAEGALFIDCTPPPDELEGLMRAENSALLVVDHHASSQEILASLLAVPEYEGRLLYGEEGQSGAWLAYRLVEAHGGNVSAVSMGRLRAFAELISISDTWQEQHPQFEESRRLARYLTFFGNAFTGIPDLSDPLLEAFDHALAAQQRKVAHGAIWREARGIRIAFVNTVDTSDLSRLLFAQGAQMVVGFLITNGPNGETIRYSLRSEGAPPVKPIAESLGGGGHLTAAGGFAPHSGESPIEQFLRHFEQVAML